MAWDKLPRFKRCYIILKNNYPGKRLKTQTSSVCHTCMHHCPYLPHVTIGVGPLTFHNFRLLPVLFSEILRHKANLLARGTSHYVPIFTPGNRIQIRKLFLISKIDFLTPPTWFSGF